MHLWTHAFRDTPPPHLYAHGWSCSAADKAVTSGGKTTNALTALTPGSAVYTLTADLWSLRGKAVQDTLLRERSSDTSNPRRLYVFVGQGGRQSGEKPSIYLHMLLHSKEESRRTDKVLTEDEHKGREDEKVTCYFVCFSFNTFYDEFLGVKKGFKKGACRTNYITAIC